MSDLSLLHQDIELPLNDKPAVCGLRQKAAAALIQTGFPDKKTEEWKYTDIKPVLADDFGIDTEECACEEHHHGCCGTPDSDRSDFIDIIFCHGKLHTENFDLPDGIAITPLPVALYEGKYKPFLLKAFAPEKHPFAALNGAYLLEGVCITVEKNARLQKPVRIIYNQDNCDKIQTNIHNIIVMEKDSQAEIFEKFVSHNQNSYLTNIVNEIYAQTGSSLNHYILQKESVFGYHIGLNAARIGKDARYRQYYRAAGAKICRNETTANLEQSGAAAEIYSAYTTRKGCLNDITANINHFQPATYSNQYAKAVLESGSSSVFQGRIHIAPNAQKTEGHQLHKALYLDGSADLNCKPELEIFADDVKCSHGASCGELDKEQLFYLMSRGISRIDAVKLLTDAHLNEILAFLPNELIKREFFA